jgi:hypothetical protein
MEKAIAKRQCLFSEYKVPAEKSRARENFLGKRGCSIDCPQAAFFDVRDKGRNAECLPLKSWRLCAAGH